MRKVLFKKWIPAEIETLGTYIIGTTNKKYTTKTKEGTSCWESEFTHEGLFHQWAYNYEESNEGFGIYTVALVELSDGTIEEVIPKNIKFID